MLDVFGNKLLIKHSDFNHPATVRAQPARRPGGHRLQVFLGEVNLNAAAGSNGESITPRLHTFICSARSRRQLATSADRL